MPKKQKVRFHKGDKKPPKTDKDLHYMKKMVKRGRKIIWQVIEKPKGKKWCVYTRYLVCKLFER